MSKGIAAAFAPAPRAGLVTLLLLAAGFAVYPQFLRFSEDEPFPDSSSSRQAMERVIFAPVGEIPRVERELVVPFPGAEEVLYRTEEQSGHLYQLFLTEYDGRFPVYAAGSYIIKRSLDDGSYAQVKVFIRSDEGFFVRIRPRGRRSEMDVTLNGRELYRRIPVAVPFDQILTLPFTEVIRSTRHLVDWSLLEPLGTVEEYQAVETMVRRARQALPTLPDAEDGAMDENGSLVFIENLGTMEDLPGFNCSGFAKWVCDGVYQPRTGSFMSIEPLKEKHLDLRGTGWSEPREGDRDPFFGLDWTRNLARTIAALDGGGDPERIHPEALDVRDIPLATYTEDMGYPVESLPHLLYYLAVRDPGYFYLGSVNREFGSGPVLRQHTHVVVLFPYFDSAGTFETVVLERNVETSVESLQGRYGEEYIHLVRVPATERFDPPQFAEP
ncbi:MAG: hypothetical protein ACOC28_05290 [Alkalispirochaetaceae bacterium]